MITVQARGLADNLSELTDIELRQIPFATVLALTETAKLVKARLEDEMRSVFDRPTPYTMNSLRLIPATKQRMEARVWIKDEADGAQPATKWLTPEVYGGPRNNKRSEALLRSRGILSEGKFLVPGRGAALDSYGNIGRGQLQKILSGLGAQGDRLQNSTTSRRSVGNLTRYFVLRKGRNAIGIAERIGKKRTDIRMVLAFVSKPGYARALDFFGIGEREADAQLAAQFEKAFDRALATRRR
ncbi:hypothetical protein [Pseudomonas baltica]|uniref:hypothetical protein n=1 Tax=Pseudomonas baltica TaxID=2762576 RepID=UPI0028A16147|nr:hypothetical protein [Pseudomonas baltica]